MILKPRQISTAQLVDVKVGTHTAWRRPGFAANPAPALLLRRVSNAEFEGANSVMFERLESELVMPGRVPNNVAN